MVKTLLIDSPESYLQKITAGGEGVKPLEIR